MDASVEVVADAEGKKMRGVVSVESAGGLRRRRFSKVETGPVIFPFAEQRDTLGHEIAQPNLRVQAHSRAGGRLASPAVLQAGKKTPIPIPA